MALSIAFTRLCGLNRSLLLFLEKICMACLLFLNMPMRLKCAPILFLNAVYRTADGIYAFVCVKAFIVFVPEISPTAFCRL